MIETIAEDGSTRRWMICSGCTRRRWRSRGECGLCSDPRVRAFHRAAACGLLAAGMLRLSRLWIGDTVFAVYYGFAAKGTAYAYLGGFDPSQPRLSPGMQVLADAIERAAAEGARRASTSFAVARATNMPGVLPTAARPPAI